MDTICICILVYQNYKGAQLRRTIIIVHKLLIRVQDYLHLFIFQSIINDTLPAVFPRPTNDVIEGLHVVWSETFLSYLGTYFDRYDDFWSGVTFICLTYFLERPRVQ